MKIGVSGSELVSGSSSLDVGSSLVSFESLVEDEDASRGFARGPLPPFLGTVNSMVTESSSTSSVPSELRYARKRKVPPSVSRVVMLVLMVP